MAVVSPTTAYGGEGTLWRAASGSIGGFPPGPRYLTPFGAASAFSSNPLVFYTAAWRAFGDVVGFRSGPFRSLLIVGPGDIKHVLQDNAANYRKGFVARRLKALLGDGLFTAEGDAWRHQRRLAQPAFHRQRLKQLVSTMTDVAESTLARWATFASDGPIDISAEMSRLTLRVAGRTLFGTDLTHAADSVGPSLIEALALMNTRAMGFVQLPMWVPTRMNWRLSRALGTLDRLVMEIIERRKIAGEEGSDLLGILLSAKDAESGQGLTTRQLRDEVMTFVLAGHETTAVALTWTFHLLSQHPEVEDRVRKEIDLVLCQGPPTFDDLPELRFTRMVIEEAMRLYPPVWAIFRQAIGSDSIRNFRVPEAAGVAICPYVTHRHPCLWPDPDRFDPERFAPERVRDRPRFAYIPFGGGPRLCIGSEFALMEAQLVLAMTLQRYRVRPIPGRTIEPESRLTLRPRGGLPMSVSPLA